MLIIHGGYWRTKYDASLGEPLAEDLAARGLSAYNLEYRRGPGSARAMLQDACSAVAAIPETGPLTVIGHSAGGQLACLLAATEPRVSQVISQAGLLDLELAAELGLSQGAVQEMLGDVALQEANPVAHWPMTAPVMIFHGTEDEDVPPELARHATEAALACGQEHQTQYFAGDHYTWIDPDSIQWQACVEQLAARHFGGTS